MGRCSGCNFFNLDTISCHTLFQNLQYPKTFLLFVCFPWFLIRFPSLPTDSIFYSLFFTSKSLFIFLVPVGEKCTKPTNMYHLSKRQLKFKYTCIEPKTTISFFSAQSVNISFISVIFFLLCWSGLLPPPPPILLQ